MSQIQAIIFSPKYNLIYFHHFKTVFFSRLRFILQLQLTHRYHLPQVYIYKIQVTIFSIVSFTAPYGIY